jgi:hypothetical protein
LAQHFARVTRHIWRDVMHLPSTPLTRTRTRVSRHAPKRGADDREAKAQGTDLGQPDHGSSDVGFLDHDEVYDGLFDPPRLLGRRAVDEIGRAFEGVEIGQVLADLPSSAREAAAACGFPGFDGAIDACLTEHFTALRTACQGARLAGQSVGIRVD